jgi:hypothetical protein
VRTSLADSRRGVRRLSLVDHLREFSAVQYALLSSLTFLIGSLGRAAIGEAIDEYRLCAGVSFHTL